MLIQKQWTHTSTSYDFSESNESKLKPTINEIVISLVHVCVSIYSLLCTVHVFIFLLFSSPMVVIYSFSSSLVLCLYLSCFCYNNTILCVYSLNTTYVHLSFCLMCPTRDVDAHTRIYSRSHKRINAYTQIANRIVDYSYARDKVQ